MNIDAASADRLIRELLPVIRGRDGNKATRVGASLSQLTSAITAARLAKLASVKDKIVGMLAHLDEAVAIRQRKHAATSPELNCWAVLSLQHSEVHHSLVLAWLLDPRASHAQGGLFFAELLRAVYPKVPLPPDCANEPYRVTTEVQHTRSRIDIEVIGQSFVLHVEAKMNTEEGEDQTCRETAGAERAVASARTCSATR